MLGKKCCDEVKAYAKVLSAKFVARPPCTVQSSPVGLLVVSVTNGIREGARYWIFGTSDCAAVFFRTADGDKRCWRPESYVLGGQDRQPHTVEVRVVVGVDGDSRTLPEHANITVELAWRHSLHDTVRDLDPPAGGPITASIGVVLQS